MWSAKCEGERAEVRDGRGILEILDVDICYI